MKEVEGLTILICEHKSTPKWVLEKWEEQNRGENVVWWRGARNVIGWSKVLLLTERVQKILVGEYCSEAWLQEYLAQREVMLQQWAKERLQ